ncbi:MAG: NAD(P)-dependent oxidoreductase, partial [Mesonia sp.]
MKILHVDRNHPLMLEQLQAYGFQNEEDYTSTKSEIEKKISNYDGLIIRSRFTIDQTFLDAATNLKFIGRLGAGLENIDTMYAKKKGIQLFSAPEGNRNAVGEHALGMLLSLFNHLRRADQEVRNGIWRREENRGLELEGKTVGLIGYGNMGKAFAKKLRGFDCEVIFYDLKEGIANEDAQQVSLQELQERAEVLSLHTPLTRLTENMIDSDFI